MGVAISSILVCMVLMIFDVFIPCLDTKVMIIIIVYNYLYRFVGIMHQISLIIYSIPNFYLKLFYHAQFYSFILLLLLLYCLNFILFTVPLIIINYQLTISYISNIMYTYSYVASYMLTFSHAHTIHNQ